MTTNTDYITCLYRGSQKNFVVPYFDFDKCEKFGIAQIYQNSFLSTNFRYSISFFSNLDSLTLRLYVLQTKKLETFLWKKRCSVLIYTGSLTNQREKKLK